MSEKERAEADRRNAIELDRAITLYGICLRDYFSTFSTYTTATSILVASLGFLVKNDQQSSPQLLVVASCGIVLCVQWYISTASLRDQYSHFKKRIEELERCADTRLMRRWLLCSNTSRGKSKLKRIKGDSLERMSERIYKALEQRSERKTVLKELDSIKAEERNRVLRQLIDDQRGLNPTFRALGSWGILRGAMLPVIYSAVFVAVIIWSFVPPATWYPAGAAAGWLLVWTTAIHWPSRRRRPNAGSKKGTA